jgi:hypothetical protein
MAYRPVPVIGGKAVSGPHITTCVSQRPIEFARGHSNCGIIDALRKTFVALIRDYIFLGVCGERSRFSVCVGEPAHWCALGRPVSGAPGPLGCSIQTAYERNTIDETIGVYESTSARGTVLPKTFSYRPRLSPILSGSRSVIPLSRAADARPPKAYTRLPPAMREAHLDA